MKTPFGWDCKSEVYNIHTELVCGLTGAEAINRTDFAGMNAETRRGVLIAFAGILAVSPDAVLIRWSIRLGASLFAIIFFKMIFVFIGLLAWNFVNEGRALLRDERYHDGFVHFIPISLTLALTAAFFPVAYALTYAANVLVLYSLAPIWSALLGSIFLNDPLPGRTIVALFGAVSAVCIIFFPEMRGNSKTDFDHKNDVGMAISLGLGFGTSVFVILSRRASQKVPNLPIGFATALGSLLAAISIAAISPVTGKSILHGISPTFFVAIIIDSISSAGIIISFLVSARYIPAVQISLISLLEVILGPLWVYVIYNERPPFYTVLSGIVVIVSVGFHEYMGLRAENASNKRGRSTSVSPSSTEDTANRGMHYRQRFSDDSCTSSTPLLSSRTSAEYSAM